MITSITEGIYFYIVESTITSSTIFTDYKDDTDSIILLFISGVELGFDNIDINNGLNVSLYHHLLILTGNWDSTFISHMKVESQFPVTLLRLETNADQIIHYFE